MLVIDFLVGLTRWHLVSEYDRAAQTYGDMAEHHNREAADYLRRANLARRSADRVRGH